MPTFNERTTGTICWRDHIDYDSDPESNENDIDDLYWGSDHKSEDGKDEDWQEDEDEEWNRANGHACDLGDDNNSEDNYEDSEDGDDIDEDETDEADTDEDDGEGEDCIEDYSDDDEGRHAFYENPANWQTRYHGY